MLLYASPAPSSNFWIFCSSSSGTQIRVLFLSSSKFLMATLLEAQVVKSLNECSGRQRFVVSFFHLFLSIFSINCQLNVLISVWILSFFLLSGNMLLISMSWCFGYLAAVQEVFSKNCWDWYRCLQKFRTLKCWAFGRILIFSRLPCAMEGIY